MIEHLKRANMPTYIWKQCTLQNMNVPSVEGRGWKEEEGLIQPVWFLGEQYPPCLTDQGKSKGYIADDEEQENEVRHFFVKCVK